jgi:uncharacterized membrane protein YfcA
MHVDPAISLAGLLVGFVVGLTGMGGGALMTPLLVLVFHVQPLAAVSSDLVTSLVMKPFGGAVHMNRGTVRRDIALCLTAASVPSAFIGVLLLKSVGTDHVEAFLRQAIGIALLASAGSMVIRSRIQAMRSRGLEPGPATLNVPVTLAIGALGGLLVGMTSVGSGSVIIVLLLTVYPALTSAELVGTDLVQAIPLVGAAALGHLLFGDVRLGLTTSLLIGAIPGVLLGAHFSSRAGDRYVRPALFVVLLTTGLKLVNVI